MNIRNTPNFQMGSLGEWLEDAVIVFRLGSDFYYVCDLCNIDICIWDKWLLKISCHFYPSAGNPKYLSGYLITVVHIDTTHFVNQSIWKHSASPFSCVGLLPITSKLYQNFHKKSNYVKQFIEKK